MNRLTGYNNNIAVKPFPSTSVEGKVNKGFAVVLQKATYTPLEVIFGNGKTIFPGDVVYVRGDTCKMPFANEVVEIEGVKCILLPEEYVKLIGKSL